MGNDVNNKTPNDIKDNKNYCIFEKRLCRYANKNGICFTCDAPSDDDMTCR